MFSDAGDYRSEISSSEERSIRKRIGYFERCSKLDAEKIKKYDKAISEMYKMIDAVLDTEDTMWLKDDSTVLENLFRIVTISGNEHMLIQKYPNYF